MSHFSEEMIDAYIDYTELLQIRCLISYLNLKQNLFYSILKIRNLNAVVPLCLYKNKKSKNIATKSNQSSKNVNLHTEEAPLSSLQPG